MTRDVNITGEITEENIQSAMTCMPTASAFLIKVAQANESLANTAVASFENASVEVDALLEDNMWKIMCSAGTFHYKILEA